MQQEKKSGLTIAIIIIALIAILAVILCTNFKSCSNVADDIEEMSTLKDLNRAVSLETTNLQNYAPYTAVTACEGYGYSATVIENKFKHGLAWDNYHKKFVLVDFETNKAKYPDGNKTKTLTAGDKSNDTRYLKEDLFVFISKESDMSKNEYAGYSFYASNNFETDGIIDLNGVSFDVGNAENVTRINYTNTTQKAKSIVIRTNSYDTVVTIDSEKDTVRHYNKANKIDVKAVSMSSYHEYGDILGDIILTKGNVVVEEGCKATAVVIDMTAVELATVTTLSADNSKATYVPIVLKTTKESWASNEHKHLIDPSKNNIIYTTPGASSTVIGDDGEQVTGEVTDAVAYNKTKDIYYMSVDKALSNVSDNETIILLKDDEIFKNYSVLNGNDCPLIEKSNVTLNLNQNTLKWTYDAWLTGAENLTIKNGKMIGANGETQSYCCFFGDDEHTSIKLTNLTCTGGINLYNTSAVIESCFITLKAGYNAVWVDSDSDVVINSGTFDARQRTTGEGVIGCSNGSLLKIKGGTFYSNSTEKLLSTSEYLEKEYKSGKQGVIVTGGLFNVNPSSFTFKLIKEDTTQVNQSVLPDGYKTEKVGDMWQVVLE